ncbi:hypothetical protein COCMIDRAFT_30263 [Bipolaris oryzae ATCC 44560]|uniref:Uncharacterized protein n=1 Tax=Bipolaris oryzae ATCC 44560 TaxID=930090 RepID=W6YNF2_COCMI|nr:uncharacterized protein COCMIDRAFT_30263 [Bipolaris oryzae ATCC 44560]EUC40867.1 hypothetical protein COCMIDRAFT_30263 [Bipolaris oryzae ATCC 44560]
MKLCLAAPVVRLLAAPLWIELWRFFISSLSSPRRSSIRQMLDIQTQRAASSVSGQVSQPLCGSRGDASLRESQSCPVRNLAKTPLMNIHSGGTSSAGAHTPQGTPFHHVWQGVDNVCHHQNQCYPSPGTGTHTETWCG